MDNHTNVFANFPTRRALLELCQFISRKSSLEWSWPSAFSFDKQFAVVALAVSQEQGRWYKLVGHDPHNCARKESFKFRVLEKSCKFVYELALVNESDDSPVPRSQRGFLKFRFVAHL